MRSSSGTKRSTASSSEDLPAARVDLDQTAPAADRACARPPPDNRPAHWCARRRSRSGLKSAAIRSMRSGDRCSSASACGVAHPRSLHGGQGLAAARAAVMSRSCSLSSASSSLPRSALMTSSRRPARRAAATNAARAARLVQIQRVHVDGIAVGVVHSRREPASRLTFRHLVASCSSPGPAPGSADPHS